MRLFLDSSALAKRYLRESGTETVLKKCTEAEEIYLSIICIPEILSAINRLRREKQISLSIYGHIKEHISQDIKRFTIVPLDYPILRIAIECLEKTTSRTLDAIHIACAKEIRAGLFLSADVSQCKAAKQLGLKTELV